MSQRQYFSEPLPKLELDSKRRFRVKHCPCGRNNKDGKFVPYVGFEDKGYCHSCSKAFLPELPKDNNWKTDWLKADRPKLIYRPKPVSFIPSEKFKDSLTGYEANNFVKYLINLFGEDITGHLVGRYFIATSKHQFYKREFPGYKSKKGATIFWQIDIHGKIRTGKIMLYSPDTGKRVKEPFDHFNFVHKLINQPEFNLKQCFFGEHLLSGEKEKGKPVAIVESEKTAIIASVYFPEFIWLATGGKGGLSAEKCSVLKGRTVSLFPDLKEFNKWSEKAEELSGIATFIVSDLLERKASDADKEKGLDLADYLIKYDYKAFAKPEPEPEAIEPPAEVLAKNDDKEYYERLLEQYPFIKNAVPVHTCNDMAAKFPLIKELCERLNLAVASDNDKSEGVETPAIQGMAELEAENWDKDIQEMEAFFDGVNLPTQLIRPAGCSTITNLPLFIKNHLATVREYNSNRIFLPYLNRLRELREQLATESKGPDIGDALDQEGEMFVWKPPANVNW